MNRGPLAAMTFAFLLAGARLALADDGTPPPAGGTQDEWSKLIQKGQTQEHATAGEDERKRKAQAQQQLEQEDPELRARKQAERAEAERRKKQRAQEVFAKRRGLHLALYAGFGIGGYEATKKFDEARDDILFESAGESAVVAFGGRFPTSSSFELQFRASVMGSGQGKGRYKCVADSAAAPYANCDTPNDYPPGRVDQVRVTLVTLDATGRFRGAETGFYLGAGGGLSVPLVSGVVIRDAEARAGLESRPRKSEANFAPTSPDLFGVLEAGSMVGANEAFDVGIRLALGPAPLAQFLVGWSFM